MRNDSERQRLNGGVALLMDQLQKFRETLGFYRKHGWRLVRALMSAKTLELLRVQGNEAVFEAVPVEASDVDAMWFTRAAAEGREAWELRLVADPPYALFELFEPDEDEEDRADVRREMEARLREYGAPRS